MGEGDTADSSIKSESWNLQYQDTLGGESVIGIEGFARFFRARLSISIGAAARASGGTRGKERKEK